MNESEKDLYYLAVKVFLRKGDELLIIHDIFGAWDLPGGRFRKNEFASSFEEVIARKMEEELGLAVRYKLSKQTQFFRVERFEQGLLNEKVHIFALGYEAEYIGGEIVLANYLDKMQWVNVREFKPGDYFEGGWLEGVKNYLLAQKSI